MGGVSGSLKVRGTPVATQTKAAALAGKAGPGLPGGEAGAWAEGIG